MKRTCRFCGNDSYVFYADKCDECFHHKDTLEFTPKMKDRINEEMNNVINKAIVNINTGARAYTAMEVESYIEKTLESVRYEIAQSIRKL